MQNRGELRLIRRFGCCLILVAIAPHSRLLIGPPICCINRCGRAQYFRILKIIFVCGKIPNVGWNYPAILRLQMKMALASREVAF
jgi:hypothetical protein